MPGAAHAVAIGLSGSGVGGVVVERLVVQTTCIRVASSGRAVTVTPGPATDVAVPAGSTNAGQVAAQPPTHVLVGPVSRSQV